MTTNKDNLEKRIKELGEAFEESLGVPEDETSRPKW